MKAQIVQMTADEYHGNSFDAMPHYSNSIGKVMISKSPRHAWLDHSLLNPNFERTQKSAFDMGSAAHSALLEGVDICEVIKHPDWRTDNAKRLRDEARKAGRIPILEKDYPALAAMVSAAQEAIATCPDLGGLRLSDGKPEQTILLNDGQIGIKMRLDWLADDREIILDYKTTEIASPDDWMRSIHKSCLDMQAGLYTKGVELISGKEPTFIFMVQETNPPYPVYFIGMAGQYLQHGIEKTNKALQVWRNCMQTGIWPAYTNRVMYADLPPYVEAQWQEKEEIEQYERRNAGKGPVTKEQFLFGRV